MIARTCYPFVIAPLGLRQRPVVAQSHQRDLRGAGDERCHTAGSHTAQQAAVEVQGARAALVSAGRSGG